MSTLKNSSWAAHQQHFTHNPIMHGISIPRHHYNMVIYNIILINAIQWAMGCLLQVQWNLYNETRKVVLKSDKFYHLPGTVFTKSCLCSLRWKTTCLERPQNLVQVSLCFGEYWPYYNNSQLSSSFLPCLSGKASPHLLGWSHIWNLPLHSTKWVPTKPIYYTPGSNIQGEKL